MSTPAWLQTLAKLAPGIASAFGTPLAGMAVSALESVLGVGNGTPEQVQAAIENATLTGDQVVQLKKADQDFAARMKQMDIDLSKLQIEDVESARAREVAVKDRTPALLAFAMIGGFFAISTLILVGLIFAPEKVSLIPAPAWALVGGILTYLFDEAGAATSYYFGSSIGSAEKNSTIADAVGQLQAKK